MFLLKKWYLSGSSHGNIYASGDVYGNYRFYDGKFVCTSEIENIYLVEKDVYILETYSGSLYLVRESDIESEGFQETKQLLEEFELVDSKSASDALDKAEKALIKNKSIFENAKNYAQENISNNELFLIVLKSLVLKAVFKYNDSTYEIEPNVHVGRYQDSVLISDREYRNVDFRYFPNKIMEPYHWSDNLEKIYIYNIGKHDFEFAATDKNIVCKAGEITEIAKDEYRGEGLFSPDVVNGKCALSSFLDYLNSDSDCDNYLKR